MQLISILFALVLMLASPGIAATLPVGFTETQVATALASPTAMQFAPDGRLFICEQGGRLRVVKDGALLPTPFLTIPSGAINSAGERGLLGVAFDPAFATNRFVYVYYTATSPAIHNRISRFTANGDVAVAGSETVILELDNLSGATNHNGGALAFGPDGKLYAAVGENANGAYAQSTGNLLGKMLRLNKDGTIPTDNPFYTSAAGSNRAIWALGLRNPFTFAFNPAGSRAVHQRRRAEHAGRRSTTASPAPTTGGPIRKARRPTRGSGARVYSYHHSTANVCAITGGAFYSPLTPQFPAEYAQRLLLRGLIAPAGFAGWTWRPAGSANSRPGFRSPVDLKVSDDGACITWRAGQARSIASASARRRPASRCTRRAAPCNRARR